MSLLKFTAIARVVIASLCILTPLYGLFGSTREGNSGFVIVCKSANFPEMNFRNAELLIFYEARSKYGLTISSFAEVEDATEKDIALAWVNRLKNLDEARLAY